MSRTTSAFILIFLATFLASGSSLNCFVCHQGTQKEGQCGENEEPISQACPAESFCAKVDCQIENGGDLIIKKCASKNDLTNIGNGNRCETEEEEGVGKCNACICDTDNCNGAVMAQISKMSIIAIFVLLMLNQ